VSPSRTETTGPVKSDPKEKLAASTVPKTLADPYNGGALKGDGKEELKYPDVGKSGAWSSYAED